LEKETKEAQKKDMDQFQRKRKLLPKYVSLRRVIAKRLNDLAK
jgi:hypothetical protein